jgi:hypothetical protein
VTVVAKAADFVLPDLLSDQGAIDSYASGLSKAVKEATESYLQEAKDAVAAIAERKQGHQASAPERSPKQADAGKGAGPSVPRAVPERVNGPVAATSLSGS